MTSYAQALDIVTRLEAAGITATCDPRGATPPCVLVSPPSATVDRLCAATGRWLLIALAPTTANLDAWKCLDELVAGVEAVLSIEGWDFRPYTLSTDNPPLPAYWIRYTEGFEL